jgi:hypothetical protein
MVLAEERFSDPSERTLQYSIQQLGCAVRHVSLRNLLRRKANLHSFSIRPATLS